MEKTIVIISSLLLFLLGCDTLTESENVSPKIESLTINKTSIYTRDTTIISCLATDSDNDNLIYQWTSSGGVYLNETTNPTTQWVAPSNTGNYTIYIAVKDSKISVSDSLVLRVSNPPCPDVPTVNYLNKVYNTVQIGNQCWLKENLDVGTMLDTSIEQSDNGVFEKYCYDNDEANCDTYGGLYLWDEAMQYSVTNGSQGICPNGWHIPTMVEFETLSKTVINNSIVLMFGEDIEFNTSGFSALLSGYYHTNKYFNNLGVVTGFWSSTTVDDGNTPMYKNHADIISLEYDYNYIQMFGLTKDMGISIRCLKNF